MSEERIDPETLAAFLDGTASPEEREGVLRTLASSSDAYAGFLEAAAIHRELTGDEPSVVPSQPPDSGAARGTGPTRWFRPWHLAPVLLAAGIVAVIVTKGGMSGSRDAIRLAQATSLTHARGTGSVARTFGDTWDAPPWSVTRGSETSAETHSLAFRAGARYAEFELAAQSADSAAANRAAENLARLLATTEAGAPVAATFGDAARSPDFGGRAGRAASAKQLRALLGGEDWFDLGVWAETARLAVAAGDVGFFDPAGPGTAALRRTLQPHMGGTSADGAEWAPVIAALQPLLEGRSWAPGDLESIGRSVGAAIAAAGR